MSYYGDIRLGDTIDVKFTTVNGSSAPTTLAGSPVISAYVGNDGTQLTAGITLSADFDGVTGLNNVRVVATSGNGYATASNYALVITTGTVGGVSAVGFVVASFSIENRSALMPTTATRTLDVAATGEAGLDFDNIKDASAGHTLTNITVPTVTTTATATALTTNNDKTGYRLSSTGVADLLTTALTESYAADGAAPTLAQFQFMLWSLLTEFGIVSTTLTTKKLDASTTAMTFTLDDSVNPTALTRAS